MPLDMLRLICTYQSPKDLNNITLTSSLMQYNGSDSIKDMLRALWFDHIKQSWNYNDNMIIPIHINIRKLYQLARPMLGSYMLLSTIEDIDLLHINNDEKDNDKSVTFFGQVGQDNRSVQSSVSFPIIPRNQKRKQRKPADKLDNAINNIVKKLSNKLSNVIEVYSNILFDNDDINSNDKSVKVIDYVYSSPFLFNNSNGSYSYYVLPRCVAYYEVIIKKTVMNNIINNNADIETKECIAIGLSSSKFERLKMLPGWDLHSYGYHSDDGGIYHGLGSQLSKFGPSFGSGDIVGCGIDYRDHSIFYTLNGEFLGKAFKDVNTGMELYPTIGIDANVTAEFNYGEKIPFEFDLIAYMASLSFFLKAD